MVYCSKCTTSGSKAVEVEAVEVEDVEVEAVEVEAAEVEAAEVEAAEVEAAEVDVWDSLTPARPEGKNIRMSEDVVPSSSSPELKSNYEKERNVKHKVSIQSDLQ
jgi:hypothetical protein